MVRNPYREFGLSDEDYIQEKFLKFWMATVFDGESFILKDGVGRI